MTTTDVNDLPTVRPARPPAGLGFGSVLHSEWTKLRTVRSTYWTSLVALLATIGLEALICARYEHLVATTLATTVGQAPERSGPRVDGGSVPSHQRARCALIISAAAFMQSLIMSQLTPRAPLDLQSNATRS